MTEHEQVAEIFRAAGWTAGKRDGWNGSFVWNGTSVVGGIDPWGTARTTGIVANPLEGPTNIVDAAHWLVEHARGLRLAPVSEPAHVFFYEAHSETGAEAGEGGVQNLEYEIEGLGGTDRLGEHPNVELGGDDAGGEGGSGSALGEYATGNRPEENLVAVDLLNAGPGSGGGGLGESEAPLEIGSEILDADFTEPTDPPPEDHPSGAFIFGDNLEQKRTAAIGLVVQEALTRLPAAIDYSRMSELRNFTMGVSEGRWPDDPAKREELDLLEATERLRRAIEAIRDAKIETLLTATREEIEAFDTGAGWP